LISLLRNLNFHIEFHSKLFIMTKHGSNNEIIKVNVNFFWWNFNQMVVMNFWKVKIGPCFQSSIEMIFFSFVSVFVPNGYTIRISKWVFILTNFMSFSFRIFKVISSHQLIVIFFNIDLVFKSFLSDWNFNN
jgi:hypothetical protein